MESSFKVLEKEKDSITLEMMNYDNTLLRPLMDEILKDEQVKEARYFIKHPIIDNPKIFIKVKSGKPQAALKRSVKRLSKVYETVQTDLQKELKKSNIE
ncbi:MAG: DNA-directed RNA polymerase subunit L [Candidatus Thermoplasmatota archaeon]|nr:DNA-directed RNA polymerase subunit L [Candidatus Thermoplasmatota archaeon]